MTTSVHKIDSGSQWDVGFNKFKPTCGEHIPANAHKLDGILVHRCITSLGIACTSQSRTFRESPQTDLSNRLSRKSVTISFRQRLTQGKLTLHSKLKGQTWGTLTRPDHQSTEHLEVNPGVEFCNLGSSLLLSVGKWAPNQTPSESASELKKRRLNIQATYRCTCFVVAPLYLEKLVG